MLRRTVVRLTFSPLLSTYGRGNGPRHTVTHRHVYVFLDVPE